MYGDPNSEPTYTLCDSCIEGVQAFMSEDGTFIVCSLCGNEMDVVESFIVDGWDEVYSD